MKSCDVDVRGLAVLQELSSDKLNVTDLRWLSLRRNCGVMPSLLAIIVLGLFLGIRHATDPDHVVAVTTIVSRERTMLHALIIGVLWGLGHTVTILIVGSGILLLKLTIPPRLGLAMELSVACMLILLGVSNLTGLMRRAVDWLAPGGYGSGTHAHVIGGRVMIHTHDAGEFVVQPRGSIFDWLRHWCQRLGTFHVLRPLAIGIVHWPCRIGCRGLTSSHNHQPAWMGGRLPTRFRDRHHCGDDANYHSDRSSVHLYAEAFCAFESSAGDSLRSNQCELMDCSCATKLGFPTGYLLGIRTGCLAKTPLLPIFRGDLVFGASILSEINSRRTQHYLARAGPK